ncbi:MAG TPA: long-chain fatty acid--CoA ligase [Myxococcota bacterium]
MSELSAALERHARERGGVPALRDAERTVTWRELRTAVSALAARFGALAPGARVLAVLPNGALLASALLAALEAEVELLGIAPRTPRAALAELAARLDAERVLAAPGAGIEAEALDFAALLAVPARRPAPARGGAILLTTSGTTGAPRIVRRSARAVDAIAASTARALALTPDDCSLLAIPLFHSYGLDQLTAAVLAGARLELHASFNPAQVRRALRQDGVSHLPAVPTMLDALARGSAAGGRAPRLRRVVSAGSALPERVARAFTHSFGVEVGQVYGSSELGTVSATQPGDPLGCVGRALPGVELRVLARESANPNEPLARGEEGVVAIASPGRFDRYLDSDEAPGELVISGDLGRLDAEGRLWLCGRTGLLIDVGAVKVNPLEIEAVLMRHASVREAVVLPLAFSDTGSRLRALIVPEPGHAPTRDALRRYAREHLIDYKVPRVFEIRADVPRSPTGKILRGELLRSER